MSANPNMPPIVFSENEKLIRQYKCTEVEQNKTEEATNIYLTTKRLIKCTNFSGNGTQSIQTEQVLINDIRGIQTEKTWGRKIPILILGIAFCALAIVLAVLFSTAINFIYAAIGSSVVFGVLGIILIWRGLTAEKMTHLIIEVADDRTAISVGARYSKSNKSTKLHDDVDKLVEELLPIIFDIQDLGVYAIEKWKARQ